MGCFLVFSLLLFFHRRPLFAFHRREMDILLQTPFVQSQESTDIYFRFSEFLDPIDLFY